jgi:hypothetical protein
MSIRLPILSGALAFTGVMALTAQAAPPPRQSDQPRAGVVATIALTGCLERWTSNAPASPTGAPAEPPPAGAEFVLTGVKEAAAPSPGGDQVAGGTSEPQYLLLPSPRMNYADHVNQTVKIVGTIAPQPSPGASPADRAIDPSSSETNLPERPTPDAYRANLVEVTTLTTVARSCAR